MTATKFDTSPLTKQQRRVLKWIVQYISLRGYSPSISEIRDAFGFLSNNSVVCHLKPLERKGCIVRDAHIARSIRVMEPFNVL